MKKILLVIFLIAVFVIGKNLLDQLGQAAKQDTPIDTTINLINRTKNTVTGVDKHVLQTQITEFMMTYQRPPKSLQEMVDKRLLNPSAILDPWGQPYEETWTSTELILRSRGEDHVLNTPDDQELHIPIGG